MGFEPGDTALAFLARGAWGLLKARAPEEGKPGLAVRDALGAEGPGVGGGFGVFAAAKPEEGKPAVAVSSPAGIPGALRLPDDDDDGGGDDGGGDDEWIGGEPCFGPHQLCSRLFCTTRLKKNYTVILSGFPSECVEESPNGTWSVSWGGDCMWSGSAGAWDLELTFFSMAGQFSWEAMATYGNQVAYAYTRFEPYEVEQSTFIIGAVPCGHDKNDVDASVVVV